MSGNALAQGLPAHSTALSSKKESPQVALSEVRCYCVFDGEVEHRWKEVATEALGL